jgi:hypothetical protein
VLKLIGVVDAELQLFRWSWASAFLITWLYFTVLVLGLSPLQLKVLLHLSGIRCIECWRFSSVSANITVVIFRVDIFWGFRKILCRYQNGQWLQMKLRLDGTDERGVIQYRVTTWSMKWGDEKSSGKPVLSTRSNGRFLSYHVMRKKRRWRL